MGEVFKLLLTFLERFGIGSWEYERKSFITLNYWSKEENGSVSFLCRRNRWTNNEYYLSKGLDRSWRRLDNPIFYQT